MNTGVVLRCPNCGTVQPSQGECEACREAAVKYFCTNHVPGVWLDTLSCPQCGARFGDPAPAREAAPPRPERSEYRPPDLAERTAGMGGRDPAPGPWDADRSVERHAPSGDRGGPPDPTRLLLAMLGAAARSRRGRSEGYEYEEHAPRRTRGGGCIGRLLMLLLLLVALFLMVPIFLGAMLGLG